MVAGELAIDFHFCNLAINKVISEAIENKFASASPVYENIFLIHFQESLFTDTLLMTNLWILNQFKSSQSCTTYASMTKVNEQCRVMAIQNCCNFLENSRFGYSSSPNFRNSSEP